MRISFNILLSTRDEIFFHYGSGDEAAAEAGRHGADFVLCRRR